MPATYQPVHDAKPGPPWSLAILAERDLALQVPINFVTAPGVSLGKACFGHNVYDTDAAILCFSNLLAAGFRRYEWDLFWDSSRRVWSFCPVQVPQSGSSGGTSSTLRLFNSSTLTPSNAVITARAITPEPCDLIELDTTSFHVQERQDPGTVLTSSQPDLSSATSFLDTSLGGPATASTTAGSLPTSTALPSTVIQLGQYSCSESFDFPVLAAVLDSYFGNTANTLEAFLIYLRLNLHAASPPPSNSTSRLNSSSMPNSSETISSLLGVNLTSFLFTPAALAKERSDVNASWFQTDYNAQPLSDYYNFTNLGDHSSSTNGWPNEVFLEFEEELRLLVEFGTIDSSMADYNLEQDALAVFSPGSIWNEITDVTFAANGISGGCLYDPNSVTLEANNNSWASFSFSDMPVSKNYNLAAMPIAEVANVSSCGISPYLNATAFNMTADANIGYYSDFRRSALWSWQYGEPRTVSKNEENSAHVRCAAMDASLGGRWRVVDCSDKHYSACRVNGDPFTWHISFTKATYTASNDACNDGQSFAVPRTALESRHLFRVMQAELGSQDNLLWLNFNSLDVQDCWVSGVNSTCPYRDSEDPTKGRKLVVPIVAAIIVFIVTALTLFVKCAANRQTSKRRRRRKGDMDFPYEGIPQ